MKVRSETWTRRKRRPIGELLVETTGRPLTRDNPMFAGATGLEGARGVEGALLWQLALRALCTEDPHRAEMAAIFHSKRWTTDFEEDPIGYLDEVVMAGAMLAGAVSGDLFHVTPEVQGLLRGAQVTLDDWELRKEDLPSPAGLMVLDEPFKFQIQNRPVSVRAMSWVSMWDRLDAGGRRGLVLNITNERDEEPPEPGARKSIEIFYYSVVGYEVSIGSGHWSTGQRLADSEFIGDDPTSQDLLEPLRTLAAFFAFVQQRVVLSAPRRAFRSERRRLPERVRDNQVRVVQLRKVEYLLDRPSETERRDGRHVTVRFWTNPFWRNQWYPSEGRHKRIWIEGYWKGPDDAPVKPPAIRINEVRR